VRSRRSRDPSPRSSRPSADLVRLRAPGFDSVRTRQSPAQVTRPGPGLCRERGQATFSEDPLPDEDEDEEPEREEPEREEPEPEELEPEELEPEEPEPEEPELEEPAESFDDDELEESDELEDLLSEEVVDSDFSDEVVEELLLEPRLSVR
jgi:C5a peptidase